MIKGIYLFRFKDKTVKEIIEIITAFDRRWVGHCCGDGEEA